MRHTVVFSSLQQSELPENYPEATARFLVRLTTSGTEVQQWELHYLEPLTERLIAANAPKDTLNDLCNNLAELGSSKAMDFVDSIQP